MLRITWEGQCRKNFQKLLEVHNERMKIEKFEKLATNLHDKTEYVIHIRNLTQALNQKALLEPYIDINTKLRQKAKNSFEKNFFKLQFL